MDMNHPPHPAQAAGRGPDLAAMRDVNTCRLIGRVVGELVYHDGDYTVTRLVLAVRASVPDAKRPDVQCIMVVLTSDTVLDERLARGDRVLVEGWLWDDLGQLVCKAERVVLLA